MLTELCKELNNWFDTQRLFGKFTVVDGKITDHKFLSCIQPEQYFRIVGSVFNDGVYQSTDELSLHDEVFDGAVWLMAVPPSVIELADEIKSWNDKYGVVDSENMSPYNSESFGGYSYSKSGGGSSDDGNSGTWQSVFNNRLKQYRKVHPF